MGEKADNPFDGRPVWADLPTPDLEAAQWFYGELFGWQAEPGGPEVSGRIVFTLGGRSVATAGPTHSDRTPRLWRVYIGTNDVTTAVERIRANGGQVLRGPMNAMDGGRVAVCSDSSGAVFGLWQPRSGRQPKRRTGPGVLAWHELATSAPKEAERFYGEVFNWELTPNPRAPEVHFGWRLEGEQIAGLTPVTETDIWPLQSSPHWLVSFSTSDCEAVAARALELGGQVPIAPTELGPYRFAVLTDSQYIAFGIIEIPPNTN
ncbi:VOC family protein [Salinactinospora qingdaonensis]|uniref:VOC family protein n=1 Tax=Salinactinospora qingdaonensis TaxID=702744 RepID=A0ABP7EYJ7_9ACTN